MAKSAAYCLLVVESFKLTNTSGHRDPVQIRPTKGQIYPPTMLLECNRRMIDTSIYPVGTKFKAWVRLKQKLDCAPHLYSYHGDEIISISEVEAKQLLARTKAKSE
jgi:hypothetical protein